MLQLTIEGISASSCHICACLIRSVPRTAHLGFTHFFRRHWKQPSRLRFLFSRWPAALGEPEAEAEVEALRDVADGGIGPQYRLSRYQCR